MFKPKAFDAFDINLIDLSTESIWKNDGDYKGINIGNEINDLNMIISNGTKSKIIILLPQNCTFNYGKASNGKLVKKIALKDNIGTLQNILFRNLAYVGWDQHRKLLLYGQTQTKINNEVAYADFSFIQLSFLNKDKVKPITFDSSGKYITTVEMHKKILTTLDIGNSEEKIMNFLTEINLINEKEIEPEWFKDIERLDDKELNEEKSKIDIQIDRLNKKRNDIELKLDKNKKIKSILYTNGNELANQILEILEEILECDLTEFEDKHKEDFKIEKDDNIFIGEIKGVGNNVQNKNVSQLDVHVQEEIDARNEEELENIKVKGILIMNTFRNIIPNERKNISKQQGDLAKRNGSLVITTLQLLELYEKYLSGEISNKDILNIFKTQIGILKL
ncbi:MAG: hypothetical protein AB1Z23_12185 [Eubacteriales bacterium]